jgi:hypothetical protein
VSYEIGELVDSIIERKAILFIGSGASAGAGLPDWPALLRELIDIGFTRNYLNADEKAELLEWAGKPDYLMLADAIRDRLTPSVFQDLLARKFTQATLKPTELHKAMAAIPFAAFVTTNFDRLFENAWSEVHRTSLDVQTHLDREALRDPLGRGFPFLFKTHGCASRPKSLVLGLREFRNSIHDNRPCQTLLQTMFLRYQVLFIGHSLTDPDLLFLLDDLVATFDVPPGRHFALIKDADVGLLRARTFRDNYGIEVLRYKATQGHPEVMAFVQDLQRQVQQRQTELRAEISRRLLDDLQQQRSAGAASLPKAASESVPQARPAGPLSASTLEEYCRQHLDQSRWSRLESWYSSLRGSTHRNLLRVNLDRECARQDLDPLIWQEFLHRLALVGPTAADPFAPLKRVADEDPGLFLLRGRRIESAGVLHRYLRYVDFERLLSSGTSVAGGHPAVDESVLENSLLGRPGHPVWCTDATYAAVTDPHVIALDLWPTTASPIVEIAYSQDVLMPDNYVRIATVPEIYRYPESDFINVKKPAPNEGDWCHTVRLDDETLKERAPSAVHAPLRLLAARTKRIGLRTIGT